MNNLKKQPASKRSWFFLKQKTTKNQEEFTTGLN